MAKKEQIPFENYHTGRILLCHRVEEVGGCVCDLRSNVNRQRSKPMNGETKEGPEEKYIFRVCECRHERLSFESIAQLDNISYRRSSKKVLQDDNDRIQADEKCGLGKIAFVQILNRADIFEGSESKYCG